MRNPVPDPPTDEQVIAAQVLAHMPHSARRASSTVKSVLDTVGQARQAFETVSAGVELAGSAADAIGRLFSSSDEPRLLGLSTILGDEVLLLNRFEGSEGISQLFEFKLELLAENSHAAAIDAQTLIGTPMTVSLRLDDDPSGQKRFFHGIVRSFALTGRDEQFHSYHAVLVPWLWLLTQNSDCRVFQGRSVTDAIGQVLDEAHADFPQIVFFENVTRSNYERQDYIVQYRESDFSFLSRLMEEEGIHYYFRHEEDRHTLVISDSAAGHKSVTPTPDLKFRAGGGNGRRDSAVTSWRSHRELVPGKHTLDDFHFQTPAHELMVSSPTKIPLPGSGKLEVYDYPGRFAKRFNQPDGRMDKVKTEAERLVELRMQEVESQHLRITGDSTCPGLAAGEVFSLHAHFDPSQNRKYRSLMVRHVAHQRPTIRPGDSEGETAYTNRFDCFPDDVPYRPPRTTGKPVIQGMQSAVVLGEPEEIETDKYGRVRVKFHWDRRIDDHLSCLLRVAQSWAGSGFGAFFWPRTGHEVLVAFLEGDPDRPIIVGSLYNAANMPPYALPEHQTRSGIKTRSLPGGTDDNFNEIRFEDRKDEEQLFFHAERNMDAVVENDDSTRVGNNQSVSVASNRSVSVGGNHSESVGISQSISIGMMKTEQIGVMKSESVGVNSSEFVGTMKTTAVGSVHLMNAGSYQQISAGDRMDLICGDSRITLESGGKVTISGTEFLFASSGPVQINGKVIDLN